ncbi:hypothetical protein M747DRAFT_40708 [Aspergillus niger ATCC 13496]|uniref:Secreted protein n=1 Tax=Aspergillus niger ATCC 13496 TaxID=1353008 RepID=A0A370C441_ASPNG|nr:hypothetical protein M747DRAFT_40708 [Aspergillus niger ATCC 13496]
MWLLRCANCHGYVYLIMSSIILIGDALFSCPSTDTVERISLDSLYPSQVQTRPSVHQIPARRCDPSSKQTGASIWLAALLHVRNYRSL